MNTTTKSLDTIQAAEVFEASNGSIFVKRSEEDDILAFDSHLKQVSDMSFSDVWSVDDTYAHLLDKNQMNYTIDTKGKIKKIEGVDGIGELSDGLLIARFEDKYGFIDPSGKIVIPFDYKEAKNFENGFAVVANEEGKFGVIDTHGKTIIPLIYYRILSYTNGLAWVSTDDAYQFINHDGEVLISENGDNYSISRSGSDITLQFGDKRYDGYGNPIPEDNSHD